MRRLLGLVLLCACGGGPVLQNAPRPNPATVAGVAAAAATAATLADPGAAARRQEDLKQPPEKRPIKVREHVPGDVLDKLDRAGADAGVP